jgi:hypothetical protein
LERQKSAQSQQLLVAAEGSHALVLKKELVCGLPE